MSPGRHGLATEMGAPGFLRNFPLSYGIGKARKAGDIRSKTGERGHCKPEMCVLEDAAAVPSRPVIRFCK